MEGRPAPAHPASRPGTAAAAPAGGFVGLDGEVCYRIAAYDRLDPFLMSVASDTDLWMFVSSRGGLTAGRADPDGSLFPYVTVDQLHDAHHHTGPRTVIRVERGTGATACWEPFAAAHGDDPRRERNLYKNVTGNRLVFEEIDHGLGLAFRYAWSACDEFGWVRTATLENRSDEPRRVALLDGLLNVLPHGAPLALYRQASNLVDAYKRTEADPDTGLGIVALTAGITDRAEALESLTANVVWCCGLEGFRVHLARGNLDEFRRGRLLAPERELRGARGNYLVSARLDLVPGGSSRWHLVCDAGRDHVQIAALRRRLREERDLAGRVEESLRLAGEDLRRNVASADGLQLTGRPESWSHHFANVLFNTMRGGVFWRNDDVPSADLADFLRVRNRAVAGRRRAFVDGLPATVAVGDLHDAARETGDPDLRRLVLEYLPLHFGRRHGDPSRPWNTFSIRARNHSGGEQLGYEGNWRDIFQNWEALCASFPGFLPGIVAKFVNASTVDGFNPYRISREGVDWETASPDDPWSNIGYWGDHQIVYLLKLLEALQAHDPEAIGALLDAGIFSYAEVPYRIRPYAEILRDPRDTIEYDTERAARIAARVAELGTDGKLLHGQDGSVQHANLLEKLLVPALSKLSNLIPDAGIWMNTQRPEWNDANNTLGGGAVSVVTLCYLRRYLAFLADRLEAVDRTLPVSTEVVDWFDRIETALEGERELLATDVLDPRDRKRLMDRLGEAFGAYRDAVYTHGFSGKTGLATARAADLCRTALLWVDRGIAANRREDGLYHGYNLLEIPADGTRAEVGRLPVMLEGQVAVLSSGALAPREALAVLEGLFASDLYRPDQRSFMLYPERELPGFMDRNAVPDGPAGSIPLVRDLMAAGDRALLARDADGTLRFAAGLRNARDLDALLDDLAGRPEWAEAVARDRDAVRNLYEQVFHHRSYTGRSGVMYAYEGLGCIYWHMVAKLLLAAQEQVLRAEREDAPPPVRDGLAALYFRIRAGLGPEKTVAEYGAFPTDPYSHTPAGGGAKQPGMTGQVKEEILTRLGELGVRVEGGALRFRPVLLGRDEFLRRPAEFRYYDVGGGEQVIALPAGSLAFTSCQVPVVYARVDGEPRIRVAFADGTASVHPGDTLPAQTSAELFRRSGTVDRIEVDVPVRRLVRTRAGGDPAPEEPTENRS